jgi:putative ABC transport system permease protein
MINHLQTALRNTWHSLMSGLRPIGYRRFWRSTNTINITGLAAGMTAAILIFLWVTNELTYDNYHPGANRIYRTTAHVTRLKWTIESAPLAIVEPIRTTVPGVESVSCLQPTYTTIRIGDEFFSEKLSAYVDSSWFSIFHYDFLAGTPRDFFSSPYSLILTNTKAKKYFGDSNPIGRTLSIDSIDYRIAGVIKDIPANSSFPFDMLIPLDALLADPATRRDQMQWNYNYQVFLKLRPNARPDRIAAAVTAIQLRGGGDNPVNRSNYYSLIPLKDIHFETDLTSSGPFIIHAKRSTVTIFSILGVFLLVIACVNYVNLTTARASLRAKEVGIRKIIGADKKSLFLQFITESFLVSALSLLITVILVDLALPAFRNLTDKSFAAPFTNPQTWQIIGITLLAATALNGIYPALLLSGFKPLNVLRGAAILKFKDVFLRKGLVVLQFTFSIILIISTLIIQRQLNYIQQKDPGYNRSQVIAVNMPFLRDKPEDQRAILSNTIKRQLQEQTSVAGITLANQSIVRIGQSNTGSADWEGRDTSFRPTVYQFSADEDYEKVMQLQMTQGRWFDTRSPQDQHNFILNETALNTFQLHQPILGQRFRFLGDTGTIIGIVKDFHFASLHEKIQPLIIRNGTWRTTAYIRTQPGQSSRTLAAARAIVTHYNPSQPFSYSFLDDQFNNLYKADQKVSTLILVFSAIAILISCLGLFALAAFTAQQRIKEIGIRKVLGATVPNIVALLSRDFVRLVLISILIAAPVAGWAMHKWLEDFAYHIPLSAGFFLAGGILALLVALLTISTQSLKAATANPIKSLRTE